MKKDSIGRLVHGGYRHASQELTPAEAAQDALQRQGLSRKEIAAKLGLSPTTVAARARIIREKTQGVK